MYSNENNERRWLKVLNIHSSRVEISLKIINILFICKKKTLKPWITMFGHIRVVLQNRLFLQTYLTPIFVFLGKSTTYWFEKMFNIKKTIIIKDYYFWLELIKKLFQSFGSFDFSTMFLFRMLSQAAFPPYNGPFPHFFDLTLKLKLW